MLERLWVRMGGACSVYFALVILHIVVVLFLLLVFVEMRCGGAVSGPSPLWLMC